MFLPFGTHSCGADLHSPIVGHESIEVCSTPTEIRDFISCQLLFFIIAAIDVFKTQPYKRRFTVHQSSSLWQELF